MNINPSYLLIENLVENRSFKDSGLPPLKEKKPSASTPFFMLNIPSPVPKGFTEHHISVFEQLNRETKGFSHYSLRSTEKVVRIFFDRFGTFFHVKAKDSQGEEIPLTKEERQKYRAIADTSCATVVNRLFQLTQERSTRKLSEANTFLKAVETHGEKEPSTFQEKLNKCAMLFKQAGLSCLYKQKREELYAKARALSSCATRLSLRKKKQAVAQLPKVPPSSSPAAEASKELFPRDAKSTTPPQPVRNISAIDADLQKIKTVRDPIEKTCSHYRLLKEKLAALKERAFTEIMKCFRDLEKAEKRIQQQLHTSLNKEELDKFTQLLETGCKPEDRTISLLVARGHIDLFKKLYDKEAFAFRSQGDYFLQRKDFERDYRELQQTLEKAKQSGQEHLLHKAFQNEQLATFEGLLELGCSACEARIGGLSLLYFTVLSLRVSKKDARKYIKALLASGGNPHEETCIHDTRIIVLPDSKMRRTEAAQLVAKQSPDIARDLKGDIAKRDLPYFPTPFLEAVDQGDKDLVKEMLQSPHPIPYDKRAKQGFTALGMVTCKQEGTMDREMVKLLLDAGFPIDQWQHFSLRGNSCRMTPLFFACQQQRLDDILLLLEEEADPNLGQTEQTAAGPIVSTPFQASLVRGHLTAVSCFLNAKKVKKSTISLVFHTLCRKPTPDQPKPRQHTNLVKLCELIALSKSEDLVDERWQSAYEEMLQQDDQPGIADNLTALIEMLTSSLPAESSGG